MILKKSIIIVIFCECLKDLVVNSKKTEITVDFVDDFRYLQHFASFSDESG